jgi:hypothetical protein
MVPVSLIGRGDLFERSNRRPWWRDHDRAGIEQ